MAEDNGSGAPVPHEVAPNAFPRLLMKLLDEEAAPDALWWLPDGKAFAMDPKLLPSKVLDPHFRRTKFSSFIRRLHNTGFRRTTRLHRKNPVLNLPEGAITLAHDMFVRGAPHLLESFSCKSVKERASYLQDAKMNGGLSSGNALNSTPGDRLSTFQEPGANMLALGLREASMNPAAASAGAASAAHASVPTHARALLDSARARLQAGGGTSPTEAARVNATTSALTLARLREGAFGDRRQLLNSSSGSEGLANPLSGLSLLQRQQQIGQESSRLRQQLLLGSLLNGNNNSSSVGNGDGNSNQIQQLLQQQRQRQSHQPQLDLQHQLQQEQQLQRIRDVAVAEQLMGARRQQMVERFLNASTGGSGAGLGGGRLTLPGQVSATDQLQLPWPNSNRPENNY